MDTDMDMDMDKDMDMDMDGVDMIGLLPTYGQS